jgi:hypothetical protein
MAELVIDPTLAQTTKDDCNTVNFELLLISYVTKVFSQMTIVTKKNLN